MSHLSNSRFRIAIIALTFFVSLAGALPASAGCLRAYGECGRCARKALMDAIWDIDVIGVTDAYVDGADCDIDLVHCLLYADHHTYSCNN